MKCGAPVIGANTSSVPEVIGWDEATFDPLDTASIAQKMNQALVDDDFREAMIKHGLERAKLFSWDLTGKAAIAAFEQCVQKNASGRSPRGRRPAYRATHRALGRGAGCLR